MMEKMMFEGIKLEKCPYEYRRVRARFSLKREEAEKLRPLIIPYFDSPEFYEQIGGWFLEDPDIAIFYGVEDLGFDFNDGLTEKLTVSMTYGDAEDMLDGTSEEIDMDRAWVQFLAPLRIIKRMLEA